jgi:activator of HSP90 ATPase
MRPVIQQHVRFPTSPQALFRTYLDSRKHTRSTGVAAKISKKTGGKFTAFAGQLEGKNLLIVTGKRIVQLWRATHWKKDEWSVLVLTFSRVRGGAQVDLVHIGVPAHDYNGVRKGWPAYYWRPWKKYFAKK